MHVDVQTPSNKVDEAIANKDAIHTQAVGNKPAMLSVHSDAQEAPFVSLSDLEDGEVAAKDNNDSEALIIEHSSTAQHQNNGDNLNITLHNSFELLENDAEHVTGEAKPCDEEPTPTILVMQLDKNPNVGGSNPVLDPVNRRQTFPITSPYSLDQSSNIGRLSFPNVTAVSLDDARDPIFHDNLTPQPIISPIITTDEILGQDKRKVHFIAGPKNLSAACLKDGKILSKFWGDEDTDATDSTLEPDTDHEAHKSNCQRSLEHDIDTDGTLANLKETHSADPYLLQHS
ncbi:hypothetical protein MTR_3g465210 [Medicago truncatula]|uniref:Uncharacterized protein n=1 Tax=Medicago truncatula TaxID=3880 RepID=A0A072UZ52_MEDTR|nr:hypothetical protein MTR_3g465210 [Medicago truncatula]